MGFWEMTMHTVMSNGEEVVQTIDLGEFTDPATELADVDSAATQISTAYNALTKGQVSNVFVKTNIFKDNTLPTENAESWDKLSLSLFLEDVDGEKSNRTAPFYVAAPIDDAFLDTQGAGYDICDTNEALVVNFVQQLAQHARIKRNETIDEAKNNGISSGHRIGVKSSRKR